MVLGFVVAGALPVKCHKFIVIRTSRSAGWLLPREGGAVVRTDGVDAFLGGGAFLPRLAGVCLTGASRPRLAGVCLDGGASSLAGTSRLVFLVPGRLGGGSFMSAAAARAEAGGLLAGRSVLVGTGSLAASDASFGLRANGSVTSSKFCPSGFLAAVVSKGRRKHLWYLSWTTTVADDGFAGLEDALGGSFSLLM